MNYSVEDWLLSPADGVWDFNLSRKGLRPCSPDCELRTPGVTWCDPPGCPARKGHVLLGLRGATQLACRLNVLGDSECVWLLRATRNSGDVRDPFEKRRSSRATARRLVRGLPSVEASEDQGEGDQSEDQGIV